MRRLIWIAPPAWILAATMTACQGKSAVSPSPLQPVRAFSLSGVVTEFRGGSLANATVRAIPASSPSSGSGTITTVTRSDGSYLLEAIGELSVIEVSRDGFLTSGGLASYATDSVVNISLRRSLAIAAGETLAATLWADDVWRNVEDVPGCHTPAVCAPVKLTVSTPGQVTARLVWTSVVNALGLRILNDFDVATWSWRGPEAHGASPLEVTAGVRSGETIVIVSFDKADISRAPSLNGQPFVLETSIK